MDDGWRLLLAGAGARALPGCSDGPASAKPSAHYDLVVIGSGFGGTLSTLWLMHELEKRRREQPGAAALRILMLERGTWWTTPSETVSDKELKTREFLIDKKQPTQEWSTGGFRELVGSHYSEAKPLGLFEYKEIGDRGLPLLGSNDGVAVLCASGVGGGSLVYSKILLRPPDTLFDDPRWPGSWHGPGGAKMRNEQYLKALQAVTRGVETFYKSDADTGLSGPSQILTRSPGVKLPASVKPAPASMARADSERTIWQIRIDAPPPGLTKPDSELIDRARIFQTAMAQMKVPYGTVDLSINDQPFASAVWDGGRNICERHGRCNIGCLPGAGQTLNKQLQRAVYGPVNTRTIDTKLPPPGSCLTPHVSLQLKALAHTDHLAEREGGGYLVHYRQRHLGDPTQSDATVISADRVIVAAGSLGSTQLMLRSQQRAAEGKDGLRGLSSRLGSGFSANGDHIAFLSGTKERINLTYGPVTTSYGQFKADAPRADGFHQVEDQGVPRALLTLVAAGTPGLEELAKGNRFQALLNVLGAAYSGYTRRRPPDRNRLADLSAERAPTDNERSSNILCVVAQGKDAANGRLSLEGDRLRLAREDGKRYHEDSIYRQIKESLDLFAEKLRPEGSNARFLAPLSQVKIPFFDRMVLTSHPLGGCPMGEKVDKGVVDEHGRVLRTTDAGGGVHRGLYIADGSILPTALGVNPALTISAVSLRVAQKVLEEWDQTSTSQPSQPAAFECAIKSASTT